MASFSDRLAAAQATIGLVFIYLAYSITAAITTWRRRAAMKREKRCQEVPWAANQWDRIFGIDLFLRTTKAAKNHNMLPTVQQSFLQSGVNTTQFVTLGRHMFRTLEPENLKTLLAIDHTKWGLPTNRKAGMAY